MDEVGILICSQKLSSAEGGENNHLEKPFWGEGAEDPDAVAPDPVVEALKLD